MLEKKFRSSSSVYYRLFKSLYFRNTYKFLYELTKTVVITNGICRRRFRSARFIFIFPYERFGKIC